jgi:hypothetical protein
MWCVNPIVKYWSFQAFRHASAPFARAFFREPYRVDAACTNKVESPGIVDNLAAARGKDPRFLDLWKRYNGMFPCLRLGRSSVLLRNMRSAWMIFRRVSLGRTTSSTKPRAAAS